MKWRPNYAKSTGRGDGQGGRRAQHRTVRVGDYHGVGAGLARLNTRDGVAVIGGGADRLAVEEPLVIQGCGALCYHAESDVSTSNNRLALWLSRDGGWNESHPSGQ